MALVPSAQNLTASFNGLSQLPATRQVGVMVGLAISIALGVAIALWSQDSDYSVLFASLDQRDSMQVVEALRRANIEHRLDQRSGAILVEAARLHEARLALAGEGLPNSGGVGFEMLNQDQGFGTSRFLEAARFQRALEGELARSIGTIDSVRRARVHLAVPKPSVFVREHEQPSASVLVELYAGRLLEKGQVDAIVNLVASSVPNLAAGRVKVIDQRGRLLSTAGDDGPVALTNNQFEYTTRLQESYIKRIEGMLAPIVGIQGVRASVAADLDFSVTERTHEQFNPDQPAVRSEQTSEESSRGAAAVGGVPGALSNQPPGGGVAPEQATLASGEAAVVEAPGSSSRRTTRNYELDKTISHTRLPTGVLRRLSVAVLVDDQLSVAEDGSLQRTARTPEEIERYTALVREAVGFSVERGDSVSVINASFASVTEIDAPPEPALWQQAWLHDLAKQAGAALLVLVLIFGVLRPLLRNLSQHHQRAAAGASGDQAPALAGPAGQPALTDQSGVAQRPQLAASNHYESDLAVVQTLVNEDPKRVAQVVKSWVGADG